MRILLQNSILEQFRKILLLISYKRESRGQGSQRLISLYFVWWTLAHIFRRIWSTQCNCINAWQNIFVHRHLQLMHFMSIYSDSKIIVALPIIGMKMTNLVSHFCICYYLLVPCSRDNYYSSHNTVTISSYYYFYSPLPSSFWI